MQQPSLLFHWQAWTILLLPPLHLALNTIGYLGVSWSPRSIPARHAVHHTHARRHLGILFADLSPPTARGGHCAGLGATSDPRRAPAEALPMKA